MSGIRISTSNIFNSGTSRISEAQAALLKTQQQISANRRILSPSDDPVAAARALEVTQSRSINSTYASNRLMARNTLEQEDAALDQIGQLLQNVKTQAIQAGNPTLDNSQRGYIATDLRGQLDQLLGLVNARDGQGRFMFSGYQINTQPFSRSGSTGQLQYVGDQGQRALQVGPARELATSDSGDAIFMRIANKSFGTAAAGNNAGNLAISGLTVSAPAATTGHDYDIVIRVSSDGGPQYAVYDNKLDPYHQKPPLATGAYTDGASIEFDGLRVSLSGSTPADGDAFTVRPSGYQDIFSTLEKLITALQDPGSGGDANARRARALAEANNNLDSALDNIFTVRAAVGSRLREIDSLDSAGEDRNIQYQQQLSQLQDLDYVKALSDLTAQQTTLEAAQKSFVKLASLSLFNLL